MRTSIKFLSLAATATLLAACNVSQDGDGTDSRQGMNGQAVDGRVANARVWVDRDGDFEVDNFEPKARTDSEGYFSYNPNSETDYCSLDEDATQYRHCLLYGSTDENAVIRIRGGIDLDTGQRLKGVMSLATTIREAGQNRSNPKIASPITTLMAESDSDSDLVDTLLGLDLSPTQIDEILRTDYSTASSVNVSGLSPSDLLANAAAIQNMKSLVAEQQASSSNSLSRSNHTCADKENRNQQVACILAKLVSDNGRSPLDFDDDDYNDLLDNAGVSTDQATRNKAKAGLDKIKSTVKKIKDNGESGDRARNRLKAATVIYLLATDDDTTETTINNVTENDLDTLVTELESDANANFDMETVSESIKNGESIQNAVSAAKLSAFGDVFPTWFVFRPKAGSDADNELDENSLLAIRFNGNENGGSVAACFSGYEEVPQGQTGDSLENQVVTGTWEKLNDGQLTLDLTWNGVAREGQLLAVDVPNNEYKVSTYDDDGERQQGEITNNPNDATTLNNVSGRALPTRRNNNCETWLAEIS